MGNTIRRQPVNFNIPNSPNYKFLNITDFKGLNITDNPFTGDPETASDLLNVYVDEQNTLTTRPRLQKKFDLKESAIIPEDATIISINHLDNKYLVQYKYEDEVCIFWLIPTEEGYEYQRIEITKSDACSPIGESKIQIAKHKNYYVFVDGVSYKIIDDNNVVCNASEKAYVPLTKIGAELGKSGSGTVFESPNILTNKYTVGYGALIKESDDIDLTSVDFSTVVNKDIVLKSAMGEEFEILERDNFTPWRLKLQPMAAREFPATITGIGVSEDNMTQCVVTRDTIFISKDGGKTFDPTHLSELSITNDELTDVIMSSDGKTIISILRFGDNDMNYVVSNNGGDSFTKHIPDDTGGPYIGRGAISNDGKYVYVAGVTISEVARIKVSSDSGNTWTHISTDVPGLSQDADTRVLCSHDGKYCLVMYWERHQLEMGESPFMQISSDYGKTWFVLDYSYLDNIEEMVYGTGVDNKNNRFYVFTKNKNSLNRTSRAYYLSMSDLDDNTYTWTYGGDVDGKETITTKQHIFTDNGWFSFDDSNFDAFSYSHYNLDQYDFTKFTSNKMSFIDNAGIPTLRVSKNGTIVHGVLGNMSYNNYAYATGEDFLFVTEKNQTNPNQSELEKLNQSTFLKEFNNFLWLGGNKNFIIHSAVTDEEKLNNVLYMPVKNKNYLGNDDNEITGFNISSDYDLVAYTKNNLWLISRQEVLDGVYDYVYTETRSDNGHIAKGQTIVTPLKEYPLQLNNKGFFVYQPIQNVLTSDKSSVLISNNVNAKLLKIENLKNAYFVNHLYWTLMFVPNEAKTQVVVLDDRDASWYYWEFNEKLVSVVNIDDEIELTNEDGRHFTLETKDIINEFNPEVTEYYDDGKKVIEWFWKSQILHLGTMNYSKKLVDTTFIVADTDMSDEYGLNYAYTAYRKMLSETEPTTITSKLNYVQSTTKRTMIPRFNFLQLKISNVEDDFDNNKLRLIGLGLKYVLLEGLLR